MAKLTKAQLQDREEARESLRQLLEPGATVYTSCNHVARSGMMRIIALYVTQADDDGKPYIRDISWLACQAMGDSWDDRRHGIRVGGCGMDMGFATVYNLGAVLWPAGTPEPHGIRNGEPDSSGGYALRHCWL
jgi:hypothetical protein